MQKILVIQTAFIGDAILATSLLEKMHEKWPNARIDYMIRKGNEDLFQDHPYIDQLWIWNKKTRKTRNLIKLLQQVRKERYDHVINVQRFLSTGLIAVLSGAKKIIGFRKNPLSFLFHERYFHPFGDGSHEIERNHRLIEKITGPGAARPRLYPAPPLRDKVAVYQDKPYVCIAPASVWPTKQFPVKKWVGFLDQLDKKYKAFLVGGTNDKALAENIMKKSVNPGIENLCGRLNLLETAALMEKAMMNYTNDSAPAHIASAMDAPVTVIFCSTVPSFGYTPLSDQTRIVETREKLACRPCGIHGKKECPEGHFKCAWGIEINDLLF